MHINSIVDALEDVLENGEWKYIARNDGEWAEWRREYEPIEEDLHMVRRRIAQDGPTKELIQERVRIKKAKYARLTYWATNFTSAQAVYNSWSEYKIGSG